MSADPPTPGRTLTVDEKRKWAEAITNRETIALIYWARAAGIPGGYIGDAVKLWALNTLAEHYRSLPPADDPVADAQVLADLEAQADEANAKADVSAFAQVSLYRVGEAESGRAQS